MAAEENLRSRVLYKLEIGMLKVIPMLLALVALLNSVLSYIGIDMVIFSYIGGISFLPLAFLYLSSYEFQFCEYHRVFLHYVLITNAINIYDYYIGIPLSDLAMLCLYMVVTGISLFTALHLYVTGNKKVAATDN